MLLERPTIHYKYGLPRSRQYVRVRLPTGARWGLARADRGLRGRTGHRRRLFLRAWASAGRGTHVLRPGPDRVRSLTFDEPLEVAACVGNIAHFDDERFAHTHAVLSRPDGEAVAGHLNAGTVWAGELYVRGFERNSSGSTTSRPTWTSGISKMREADERYFETLETRSKRRSTRSSERKGKAGPQPEVEIPVAKDMADRVENILGIPGVAERVRELEGQMSREEAALELVEDFVEGTVGDYDSREA